ncbi:hypothetical protein [Jiulongibacter sp. NS-SX5]|uniref:hypothetical protein n=1 Tax=Jiulongibacter sp. NS-SX5 TaxID=3463854 RepID=UPI004059A438
MVNFASIRANSSQKANPGGLLKLAKMSAHMFTAEWPAEADVVDGEVTGLPSAKLPVDTEWPIYAVPKDTVDFRFSNVGQKDGYTNWSHALEYDMANLTKELVVEIQKDVNNGAVYIGKARDGQWYVIGNSDNPIFPMHSGGTGKLGSDKRGTVVTAEEEGYMFPMLPLAPAVVADITFEAFA